MTELAVSPMRFDGATYDHARDSGRLAAQMGAVFDLMKDGVWRSLAQIAEKVGAPESSVSARLRDLRKPRFGGYSVGRRYVCKGLFVYQLTREAECYFGEQGDLARQAAIA